MPPAHVRGRLSRRALLRLAGASCAALAGASLLPAGLAAAPSLAIGVLLPRAPRAPQLADGLLRGLSHVLQGPDDPPFHLRTAWYEGDQRAALQQAEALVRSGVALVIAAMSRNEAAALGPLLAERRVPLLVTDMGATLIRAGRLHPFVFRSSLGHWQAAWALGQWAAQHVGRHALIASGFYDSGFDIIYGLWSGFEAGGGATPGLVVTGGPGAPADSAAAARQARAELVLAAYTGPGARRFVQSYSAAGLGALPALGTSTLAADNVLRHGGVALGLRTAASWAPDLPAAAGHDEFTALGYDTGLLVRAALASSGGRPALLRDALAAATAEGVRGHLAFAPETQEVAPAIALRVVEASSAGPRNRTLADLTALARNPLEAPRGPRSGWRDAFLMV